MTKEKARPPKSPRPTSGQGFGDEYDRIREVLMKALKLESEARRHERAVESPRRCYLTARARADGKVVDIDVSACVQPPGKTRHGSGCRSEYIRMHCNLDDIGCRNPGKSFHPEQDEHRATMRQDRNRAE